MKKFFIIGLVLSSYASLVQAREYKPYKIVLFADPDALARAEEFKSYLSNKPPFSKMGEKLTFEVVQLSVEEMDCSNDKPDTPRIISCNSSLFRKKQREMDAHLSLAFTSKGSGGAGGGIPVASKDYPIQTMFHEMLHTYGFADEYDYKDTERGVYCKKPSTSANIAYFQDVPPYETDVFARDKHNKDVPWMGGIPLIRLITKGTDLGSDSSVGTKPHAQLIGLFRGGQCDSANLPGWRPYENSIMRGYADDTIYPLYEEVIVKNIEGSLGRKLELPPPPTKCFEDDFSFTPIQHLHNDIEKAVRKVK